MTDHLQDTSEGIDKTNGITMWLVHIDNFNVAYFIPDEHQGLNLHVPSMSEHILNLIAIWLWVASSLLSTLFRDHMCETQRFVTVPLHASNR